METIDTILIPNSHGKLMSVKLQDIVMLKAESNYTFFFLNNGQQLLATRTLRRYQEVLGEGAFMRVHKSYLVNVNYLAELNDESVVLQNGHSIKVARRRKLACQHQAKAVLKLSSPTGATVLTTVSKIAG